MIETLLVIGVVALLAAIGWLAPLLPAEWPLFGGALVAAAGMGLGVPTGFWYHVKLRACLAPRGALPERWWLKPTALHDRLRDEERPGVIRWFVLGGLGFGLTVFGCVLAIFGLALDALRSG